jgi:pimeloyl-ACP methyl ester carboxylesterase
MTLYTLDGAKVAVPATSQTGEIGADGTATVTLTTPVTVPKLWSAEKPNLYYVFYRLSDGNQTVERVQDRIGFRKVELKKGVFTVNGVPVKFCGTCRHEEFSPYGKNPRTDFEDYHYPSLQDPLILTPASTHGINPAAQGAAVAMHASRHAPLPSIGLLLLALLLPLFTACDGPLATLMVSTPNRFNPLVCECNPLPPIEAIGTDQHFTVSVGPPKAALSVSVVEPSSGGIPAPAKGTVLVVHGIFGRSLTMLHTAHRLAEAGYRAVLVDLRGHGRSTGEYLTYGTQEARDLSQVIDVLQARGLAGGPIGVYGISYGATTSIHLAALDRRVKAVVAVEPFSMVRSELAHFAAIVPQQTFEQALREAGCIAGFDPDGSDAADAIGRTSAPVLLMHGTDDWIVPYWNSVLLRQEAVAPCELVTFPQRGHQSLWLDFDGELARRAVQWFDRWLVMPE